MVRKVDGASGEVTIAHEAIPGFMPAMTMPFTLKNKAALEDIRPGDEVEGVAHHLRDRRRTERTEATPVAPVFRER